VPQYLSDFIERETFAQHVGGEAVTKLMRTFSQRIYFGSGQSTFYHRSDRLMVFEAGDWRF
jgi:hypothetical protein